MKPLRSKDSRLLAFARRMRSESADAEAKLWSILRSRSLAGFKFRRQHPVEGYILDFYCVKKKLAIELDGGQHNDPIQSKRDDDRTKRLAERGVRIVRFWDHDMLKDPDVAAEEILRCLTDEEPSPQPSPGLPGEGVKSVTPSPGTPGEGQGARVFTFGDSKSPKNGDNLEYQL